MIAQWFTRHRAHQSVSWLRRHWLGTWAAQPGAHLPVPDKHERTARLLANEALDCPVWKHHCARMNAEGSASLRRERDALWATAMHAARSCAAYYLVDTNDVDRARAELMAVRAGIHAKAGKLDVPIDPFAGALS